MINQNFIHCIAPMKVIRGNKALEEGLGSIPKLCKKPIILGRSKSTISIRENIINKASKYGIKPISCELQYDCCEDDLNRVSNIFKRHECDGIIAAGGGKVLDAGKLLGNRLNVPCITIPTSAATCAGWTSLSNIYSTNGAFIKDQELKTCPTLLIIDYSIIRTAPSRTLTSGVADAIAKWYESSLSCGTPENGLVEQAIEMARVLRDQLILNSKAALQNSHNKNWEKVVEGCTMTAGLIGGIGGEKCRTAAAHALHNGITQLETSQKSLHGEIVGFGLLVQMNLEENYSNNKLASQSKLQLLSFLYELNLPITLGDLGLKNTTNAEIKHICQFSCKKNSEIHNLPFHVDEYSLFQAIIKTNQQGEDYYARKLSLAKQKVER